MFTLIAILLLLALLARPSTNGPTLVSYAAEAILVLIALGTLTVILMTI